MKKICSFILWLFGWKIKGAMPTGIKKCVLIVAPHTSYWDFILGKLSFGALGFTGKFFIKKKYFVFLLGPLLKAFGAVPVGSSKWQDVLHTALEYFKNNEEFILVITPEGTRKRAKRWRKGFYEIAMEAQVPLVIGTIDYAKKELHIICEFKITGDFVADLLKIEKFYSDVTAKHPAEFNRLFIGNL